MIKASVIVPTYNEQDTIQNCLESLSKQTCKYFEIILVDDGSTDNTITIAKTFRSQVPNLKILRQNHKGAGATRNFGALKAKEEVLLFTDSDCIMPKNWVKNHLNAHQRNRNSDIIFGGVKKPKERSLLAWTDFFSSWFNCHEDLPKQEVKEYAPTLNFSIKKATFIETGGFWKKHMTGEDVEFCLRARKIGAKMQFDPSLALWHQGTSFKRFLKHNFNWGRHAPFVRGKNANLAYHFLFNGNLYKSLLLFFPIAFGYPLFLAKSWLPYHPLRFLVCFPLILTGKLAYSWGTLVGSWEKSLKK